jgi:hypothetical protein
MVHNEAAVLLPAGVAGLSKLPHIEERLVSLHCTICVFDPKEDSFIMYNMGNECACWQQVDVSAHCM